MNAMSLVDKKTFRPDKTSPTTSRKVSSPKKEQKSDGIPPKVLEKPAKTGVNLLSPPARPGSCIPLTSPRVAQTEPGSPYKSPSSRAGAPAPDPSASLRAYLEGLKSDNLANVIFRDQTAATLLTYPVAWISQVQASLEPTVDELYKLAPVALTIMPQNMPGLLYPEAGCEEGFDWQLFKNLCAILWPEFSSQVISLESLPPRTLGLLAELHQQLAGLDAFRQLQPDARDKVLSDALFNLLIWNGIFSPLTKMFPDQYLRLVNGLCSYVKAAWGVQAQTQGNIGQAIISMVPTGHAKQCSDFSAALTKEVRRVALLRTVQFHDQSQHPALNRLREKNIDRHFTDTWRSREDDYDKVLRKGDYYLTDADGVEYPCKLYKDLCNYVDDGSKKKLPQVVLHVAGERIGNFLCHTYLYDGESPLFTDAKGQRVDPVPTLSTRFVLSRNEEGTITVRFSSVDHEVKSAMLLAPGDDDSGIEATPLFQASLEFHGEFYFYPEGEQFEIGSTRLIGQNLHLFHY